MMISSLRGSLAIWFTNYQMKIYDIIEKNWFINYQIIIFKITLTNMICKLWNKNIWYYKKKMIYELSNKNIWNYTNKNDLSIIKWKYLKLYIQIWFVIFKNKKFCIKIICNLSNKNIFKYYWKIICNLWNKNIWNHL